jgi:hypothetical protein
MVFKSIFLFCCIFIQLCLAVPPLHYISRPIREQPYFIYTKHSNFDGVSLLTFSERTGDAILVDIPTTQWCSNKQNTLLRRNTWSTLGGRRLADYLSNLPSLNRWCPKVSNYIEDGSCSEGLLISPDETGRISSNETYYVTYRLNINNENSLGLSEPLSFKANPENTIKWWMNNIAITGTETQFQLMFVNPVDPNKWVRVDVSDNNQFQFNDASNRIIDPTNWYIQDYLDACKHNTVVTATRRR